MHAGSPTGEYKETQAMRKQSVSKFALPNSKPKRHPGARVGVPPQHKRIKVVMYLKRGAIDKSLRVERFATEHELKVEELRESTGQVVLSGMVGNIEKAFNVKLVRFKFQGFVYRTNLTAIHVPESLATVVRRVSGLNTFRVATGLAPHISADPLLGTWTNSDSATQGIVQVILTKAGSGVTVHAFGVCTPSPCDMGTVHGSIYADSVSSNTAVAFKAAYKFSFKVTMITGSLQGSSLILETFDHFTDGSRRPNYYSTYTMVK
jgi:hypothetical protein